MKLKYFKEAFDPLFLADIEQKIKKSASYSPDPFTTSLLNHLKSLSIGGKRFRPYALVLAYQTETGDISWPEDLLPVLFGLEYLHLFALIHDDIMDKSFMRHGVDTIEVHARKELEKSDRVGDISHLATAHAILIGDLVFSWSLKSLHSFPRQNGLKEDLNEYIHAMIDELVMGQMLDIDMTTRKKIEPELIKTKMKIKSGNYTFVHPMAMGAILAQSNPEFYKKVGTELGMAFQLGDDLLDILPSAETGKSSFVDVQSRNYTMLIQSVYENCSKEDQDFLQNCFGENIDEVKLEKLKNIYQNSGCVEKIRHEIESHLTEAKNIIAGKDKISSRSDWDELLNLIQNRNH